MERPDGGFVELLVWDSGEAEFGYGARMTNQPTDTASTCPDDALSRICRGASIVEKRLLTDYSVNAILGGVMTVRQRGEPLERAVFVVHGVVTLAAAVVLAAFPAVIPATVGIVMANGDFLLSYFLAAAELGIATISVGAARLTDRAAIRLIAVGFAAFHLVTAVLESLYLARNGLDYVLTLNISGRVVAGMAFLLVWRARRS